MRKIIVVVSILLFTFVGISEAKTKVNDNVVLSIGTSLAGTVLNPGESVVIFELPSNYHHYRLFFYPGAADPVTFLFLETAELPEASGYWRPIPYGARSLVLKNYADNFTITFTYCYVVIELME